MLKKNTLFVIPPKLNQEVTIRLSDAELDIAKKAISDIKLANKQLQSSFGNLVNEQVSETFSNIEKSLSQISGIFNKTPVSVVNSQISNSTQFTMKRHSFLEIFKRSMPRHAPKSVKINLPREDIQIYGHMYKLIVLFSSLIENSIQAMNNSGEINIVGIPMGSKVRIQIQDSGPGIPDEVLDKLFSTLATTKKHGSGLGTKMAKSIVDLHKGTISVSNNPTTFTIDLPFQ